MMNQPVRVAVVTGGHVYDVQNFHRLFRRLASSRDGIDAYIQHMDDFASEKEAVRDAYDAVVFYIMLMDTPPDEERWPHGNPYAAVEHLGTAKQGVLVLHHATLAYPQWPTWNELVGIPDRKFDFYVGQDLHIEIADAKHPITKGLAAWDMVDETYTMLEPDKDSHVLLTAKHPKSMKAVGWTRQRGQARVFCFQSGHDNLTWENAGFTEVLRRGILWCARRI
jgi:type 1 glutamine amidotransferase